MSVGMQRPHCVAVRLSDEELRRLTELERRTRRQRSDLLRLLIMRASASGLPDVRLDLGER